LATDRQTDKQMVEPMRQGALDVGSGALTIKLYLFIILFIYCR